MAKSVSIQTKENTAEIIVDGNEISDVLSHSLIEDSKGAVLKLRIAIMDSVSVRRCSKAKGGAGGVQ